VNDHNLKFLPSHRHNFHCSGQNRTNTKSCTQTLIATSKIALGVEPFSLSEETLTRLAKVTNKSIVSIPMQPCVMSVVGRIAQNQKQNYFLRKGLRIYFRHLSTCASFQEYCKISIIFWTVIFFYIRLWIKVY